MYLRMTIIQTRSLAHLSRLVREIRLKELPEHSFQEVNLIARSVRVAV